MSTKIAVFGDTYREEKIPKIQEILSALIFHGADLYIDHLFYDFLIKQLSAGDLKCNIISSDDFHTDIALSLGGDGTFLQTAGRIGNKNIPILGINLGRLGFLADIAGDEIHDTLKELFESDYRIEERSLLQVEIPGVILPNHFALNEVAILKQDTSSMITIDAGINGNYLNTYLADGLVIATPTGSTAYSLSIGGPVIVPQSSVLSLTPIAPHSLNARPLVITDNNELTLTVSSRSSHFLIALDGRSTVLDSGMRLTLKKANHTIKVIKRKNYTFYDTLREKLMWGADRRNSGNANNCQ